MKHIFIINPTAGKRNRTTELMEMAKRLEQAHGIEVECILTKSRGHAAETCREIASRGEPVRFYACGGDGTINEVANGILGFDNAAMTCIPSGTGNDFLKNFGPDAAERFADAENLWDGPQFAMDAIDCNGHCAVTVACCGFDAQVAEDVHTYGKSKYLNDKGSYIASLAVNFLVRGLGHRWSVTVDGETALGDYALAVVCNGRYYGGGFMPMGEARMDDGVLNALVRKISRLEFLQFVGPYSKSGYSRFPHAAKPCTPRELVIESADQDIVICLDGEIFRDKRVVIKLSDKKVNVFGPAGFNCNATARD